MPESGLLCQGASCDQGLAWGGDAGVSLQKALEMCSTDTSTKPSGITAPPSIFPNASTALWRSPSSGEALSRSPSVGLWGRCT